MTKKTIINLAGIEGFDENGQPVAEDVTIRTSVTDTGYKTAPEEVIDENVRIVADQPVVDDEKLPEEEATVNEEITRETIAIEELEEVVTNVDQQQQNVSEVSDQIEDTISDIRPTIESGVALGEESIKMINSLRRRIKDKNGVTIGNESYETQYGVETFGLTKSTRLTNSHTLLDLYSQEAIGFGKSLKAVSIELVKTIIDLINKLINYIDLQGSRSKKLKERLKKIENYREGVEFESSKIANAFVKNKNGEIYDARDFAQLVANKSTELPDISNEIKNVLMESTNLAKRIEGAANKPESAKSGITGAVESVKQFFKVSWDKIKAPKLASGQMFVGLTLEGETLAGVTKKSVEAKSTKLKTIPISTLNTIVDLVSTASENVKKGRSNFGAIYKAKSDLGTIADSLIRIHDKIDNGEGKDEIRQACKIMVREGRDQLQALKDLTLSCSKGASIANDFVDLCISKGTKKPKKDKNSDGSNETNGNYLAN